MYELLLVCFAIALVPVVEGYSSGAGASVCSTMIPGHYVAAQSSSSPYTVGVSTSTYDLGGTLTVTLSGSAIRGFLIKALRENDLNGPAVGSFSVAINSGGTALSQDRCEGGATHTSDFVLVAPSSLQLTWNSPSTDVGNVKFYTTFVKQQLEIWVQVPSATIAVNVPTTTTTTSTTTTSTTTTSTTTATSTTTTSTTTTSATTPTTPTTTTMSSDNNSTVSQPVTSSTCQPTNPVISSASALSSTHTTILPTATQTHGAGDSATMVANRALLTLGAAILLITR